MALPSIFDPSTTENHLNRLDKLTNDTIPQWGKMNAAQMLAHLNVAYDMNNGKIPVKYNFIMKFILKKFVKPSVAGEKSYPRNSKTAPVFIIGDERDFEAEKAKLIANIKTTQELGASHFEGKESVSFGPMKAMEWSNQFYKHIEHHFEQFGI